MARTAIDINGPDELPEADRLQDFPHPRHTETVFGHERAEATFSEALNAGRMHHAWLLTGPEGIGKATFAYKCACSLLAEGETGDGGGRLSDRLLARLAHPRMLLIRRPFDLKTKKFSASIPIDSVRRLRPFVGKTAERGAWRIVIIDTANELNISAANALLKVLEEPPRQTVFFLIASEPGRLLATIRSRCRTLSLASLEGTSFAHALTEAWQQRDETGHGSLTPDRLERLSSVAQGSVRRALVLADNDGEALLQRIDALFEALPQVDWTRVRDFADELSAPGQEGRFKLALELVLQRIAALATARTTGAGRDGDLALSRRLIADHMVARWAELWERIAREQAETQALNLDRKSLIFSIFSGLVKASTP